MPSIPYPRCVDCGKQLDRPNRKRCLACYRTYQTAQSKIIPETRRCSTCRELFPLTAEYFHRNKRDSAGFARRCKTCTSVCGKQWRDENPERKRENDNRWRLNNLERVAKKNKRWRKNNMERERQNKRRWRYMNPEKNRANRQRARINHPDRERARGRKNQHNRIARRLNAEGTYTQEQIQAQYERQNGRCYYAACGHAKLGDKYHIEHVIPLSRGGRNDISNIVLSCPRCNFSKHDKLPHEWPDGGRLL